MSNFDDGGVDAVVVAAADAEVDSDAEADVDDWRRVREKRAEGLFRKTVDNELTWPKYLIQGKFFIESQHLRFGIRNTKIFIFKMRCTDAVSRNKIHLITPSQRIILEQRLHGEPHRWNFCHRWNRQISPVLPVTTGEVVSIWSQTPYGHYE